MSARETQHRFGRFFLEGMFALIAVLWLSLALLGRFKPLEATGCLVSAALVITVAHAIRPETGWGRLAVDVGVVAFVLFQFVMLCFIF